ncbi:MAG: hypothetical protein Q9214_003565, partial [Letrouitia sp. 1 TL-2023]
LANMAFEVLVSVEKLVDASVTLTISSLIFGKKWSFDKQLKDWCFKHISTHLLELKQMPEWRECLRKTDHELSERWGGLMNKNAYLINVAEAAAEQRFVEGLAREMPYVSTEPSDRRHQSEETVSRIPLMQPPLTQVLTGKFAAGLESDRLATDEPVTENDEDWDEDSSKNTQSSNTTTSPYNTSNDLPLSIFGKEPNIKKLQRLLGVDQNSTDEIRKQEPWLNLSPAMDDYPGLSSPKARAVLGISSAQSPFAGKEVNKSSVSTPTKMKAKVRAWRNSASSGGSGSSGRSGNESFKSMTEDLREVVESLGYENVRVSLVGLGKCSFGCEKQTEYGYFTAPAEAPFSINGLEDGSTSGQICVRPLLGKEYASYDAFLIACFSPHPLVPILRTRKIVVGIFDAAVMTAVSLLRNGEKFGILTTGEGWREVLMDAVTSDSPGEPAALGDVRGRALLAGVECVGLDASELEGEEGRERGEVERRVKECARRFRDRDVRVVVLGCAGMVGMEGWVRSVWAEDCERTGGDGAEGARVRVVDGVKAGVGILQGLVRGQF